MNDWYHNVSADVSAAFQNATTNTNATTPSPDSGLINGAGRFIGGTEVARSVIGVTSGKRYRFRVINTSAMAAFKFSVEGHSLTIIEADGISHKPLVVDSFDIYAGQRISVVLNANETVDNYWIRAPVSYYTLSSGSRVMIVFPSNSDVARSPRHKLEL